MNLRNWIQRILGIRADTFVSLEDIREAPLLPRTSFDYATSVRQGLDSNVIMAPVQWIMRTFTQAEPIVERRRAGQWQRIEEHAAELLLAQPNRFYDGDALTKALLLSYFLDGNAYALKVRSQLGAVVELWYEPHWAVEPKWPPDGSEFISHYERRVNGVAIPVRVEDVVHLRFGLNPRNPRKGLSPLRAVLREVFTDEEAANFTAGILMNMGVPGGIISPKDGGALPSAEDVKDMKQYMDNFTGDKRGKWLAIGAPTEVHQFGFDPNQLMLANLRDITEERVCAMLGLPAAIVGFGAGLQSTKVGATMREMVRLARVNCIEPTQMSISRQLSRQLLADFETRPNRFRVAYDNSNVSMFQEDETARAQRAATLVQAGIARVDQAQEMVGLEKDPSRAIYLGPPEAKSNREEPPALPDVEDEEETPVPPNRLSNLLHENGRE